MNLEQRIDLLARLGEYCVSESPGWSAAKRQASAANPWFTPEFIETAVRGIAAGFLGAGLFGLLFGQGFFGGMAGFASIIGLLLQVVLVVIVARLIFRLVAAAQYVGACLCGGASCNGS